MNFENSANAMEAGIAVKVWNRSEEKHGLRYTKFVGDGDSKSFDNVCKSKPYGQTEIKKADCVVQKRMGKGLKDFKTVNKKLTDRKPPGE